MEGMDGQFLSQMPSAASGCLAVCSVLDVCSVRRTHPRKSLYEILLSSDEEQKHDDE